MNKALMILDKVTEGLKNEPIVVYNKNKTKVKVSETLKANISSRPEWLGIIGLGVLSLYTARQIALIIMNQLDINNWSDNPAISPIGYLIKKSEEGAFDPPDVDIPDIRFIPFPPWILPKF